MAITQKIVFYKTVFARRVKPVWASYKALADAGWTQQRIADAKGVSQTLAAFRLQLADLPHSVLNMFITNDSLNEGHAREIAKLLLCNNLRDWLNREAAMLEVIEKVLAKCTKAAAFSRAKFEKSKHFRFTHKRLHLNRQTVIALAA